MLKKLKNHIDFIKIDGSKPSNYGSLTKISGFPTIFIYDHKKLYEYKGPLEKEKVKSFIMKYNFSCQRINNNIDKFIKENSGKEFILGYFDKPNLIEYFKEINSHNRLLIKSCYYIVDGSQKQDTPNKNQIIISNKQGDISYFNELESIEKFKTSQKFHQYFIENLTVKYSEFLKNKYFPFIDNINHENIFSYRQRGYDYIIFSYKIESERVLFEKFADQVGVLLGFGKKYSILTYQISNDGVFEGFEFNNYPCVVICEPNFLNIEIMSDSQKFNLEDIIEFIKNSAVYDKNIDFGNNPFKTFKQFNKITYKTAKIIDKEQMKKEEDELKKEEINFLQQNKINFLQQSKNISEQNQTKTKEIHIKIHPNNTDSLNSTEIFDLHNKIASIIHLNNENNRPRFFMKAMAFIIYLAIYSVIFYAVYNRFFSDKLDLKSN